MRVLVQRVKKADVLVKKKIVGSINNGILIYVGIDINDENDDLDWITKKVLNLRIFNDEFDLMNYSVRDVNGEILLISQFTLMASTKKGNRPSYVKSANHKIAVPLYESLIKKIEEYIDFKIQRGIFGADMTVTSINDGPVNIYLDSKKKE
tara:strand:+ start:425 stop:877 length:453 start_codon:yes stop_codon:yes gene_type:complete